MDLSPPRPRKQLLSWNQQPEQRAVKPVHSLPDSRSTKLTENGTFQCIPNSLRMKASSPQIHVLCSTASHRGLFRILWFSRTTEACLPDWKLLQDVLPQIKQFYLYQTLWVTSSKPHQLVTGASSTARTGCSAPGNNTIITVSTSTCSAPTPSPKLG